MDYSVRTRNQSHIKRVALAYTAAAACNLVFSAGHAQEAPAQATQAAEPGANCKARGDKPSASVKFHNPVELFEVEAYSAAVSVPEGHELIFVSGQIPVNISYDVQGEGMRQQVRMVLDNLCAALKESGATLMDVVKINVSYVHSGPQDPFVISEELLSYFQRDEMPATTMMGVSFLIAENIKVQVDAVAVRKVDQ